MPLPPAPRRGRPDRGWRSPGRSAGRSRCHAPEDAPGRDRVLRRSAAFVPATSARHIDGTVGRFRRRAVPSERCRARRDWLRERVPVGVGRDVVPVRQPQFADQRLGGRTSDRHHGGDRIVGYPSDAVSGPGAERELSSSPTRLRPQLRVRRWPSQHGRRLSSIRAELDQQFEIADRQRLTSLEYRPARSSGPPARHSNVRSSPGAKSEGSPTGVSREGRRFHVVGASRFSASRSCFRCPGGDSCDGHRLLHECARCRTGRTQSHDHRRNGIPDKLASRSMTLRLLIRRRRKVDYGSPPGRIWSGKRQARSPSR